MELKATRLEKAAGVGLSLACFFTTDEAHGMGIVNEPVAAFLEKRPPCWAAPC